MHQNVLGEMVQTLLAGYISPRWCEILKFVLKVAQSGIIQISKV
jgi:hypothetical protein